MQIKLFRALSKISGVKRSLQIGQTLRRKFIYVYMCVSGCRVLICGSSVLPANSSKDLKTRVS